MADDKHANKVARSVFNKRGADLSMADIRVSHGICYIRGTIKFFPGRTDNKEATMSQVIRALRQQAEIRDVICEYTIR
ncbi:MAG TPA: hypothetical protein VKT78_07625 [Fimbriimonadaceae bacterium]|nr:hypothetical protein [Fimbriimonadaceae bacterium]